MARVKRGVTAHARHKKVLAQTKGHYGANNRLYKRAHESMMRSLAYAYRDRRVRKRDFRSLWITRITAAVTARGLRYSQFIYGLKLAGIELNRKMLSEIAIHDPEVFDEIVAKTKSSLDAQAKQSAAS